MSSMSVNDDDDDEFKSVAIFCLYANKLVNKYGIKYVNRIRNHIKDGENFIHYSKLFLNHIIPYIIDKNKKRILKRICLFYFILY